MRGHTYLCIDIGGTKLCTGVSEGQCLRDIQTTPVQKGIRPLLSQIQTLVTHYHSVTSILIGCPGHIINGAIAAGSAQNLGTFPGEFDGFDLRQALEPLIQRPVHVFNDATAQMAGGYALMQNTLPAVSRIGYIGPGTGLGGGFAKIEGPRILPITDGHIFDIYLPRAPGDPLFPGEDMAENLLSGRAFFARTGHKAHDAAKVPDPFRPLMKEWGQIMATLIKTLYEGRPQKPTGHAWSADDIAFVSTLRHYLVGGGLGSSHPFGDWLLSSTRAYLTAWEIPISVSRISDTQRASLLGLLHL